jgi:two-component system sensor kinase FixL
MSTASASGVGAAGAPARAADAFDPTHNPALLSALFEHAPGLCWTVDADRLCRFISRPPPAGFGIEAGRPVDSKDHLARHQSGLAGEREVYEIRCYAKVFRCQLEPLRDAGGAIRGLVGIGLEITEQRVAAATLALQQDVFQAVLEQAADGVAIVDPTGRVVFLNAGARRLADTDAMGTKLADGTSVWGEWHQSDGSLLQVEDWPFTRALRGQVTVGRPICKKLRDGGRLHILLSTVPLRDPGGKIAGAVATFVDITAQKEIEEKVRQLNDELEKRVQARTAELEAARLVLDREAAERRQAVGSLERSRQQLLDIVNNSTAVIYLKDTAGRYLLVNRQFERLFKASNEEIVGKTDYDHFPAEVVVPLRANDERVMAEECPIDFEEIVPEDDGDHVFVSVKFPLRDAAGAIYGVCGISTDITARKRTEAELRRSEAALSAVIESSTDAIWSVDRDHHVTTLNAVSASLFRKLLGVEPRLGEPMGDVIPQPIAERWLGYLDRGLAGERFLGEESVVIDGVSRHFLISLNPTLQDGRVVGVTVFGKDVTELKRAEEQAHQHQAELAHVLRVHTIGEMAASLAHEINQPLGAIANYAQGCRNHLLSGREPSEEFLRVIEQIAAEALRAGEITRRVRELLRKETGAREPAALNEIVRRVLHIVQSGARRVDVTLRFEAAEELPPLCVDVIQIEQVLINLLLNGIESIDGTRGVREVVVRTSATAPGEVEVSVCDTGIGLGASFERVLFEPFFTTKPNGLGMGLAISRSIVQAHGGRLWAERLPEGGACFRFTLPAER